MYTLRVIWKDGRVDNIESGWNPSTVREAHNRVSRNARLIARIELQDNSGSLETIWAASWDSEQ